MNFADIIVSKINIIGKNIKIDKDGILRGTIEKLYAKDKSGWGPDALTGEVMWDGSEVLVNNLYLDDEHSKVKAKYLSFKSQHKGSMKDFINKIIISADFDSTIFNFRTIGEITPSMNNNHLKLLLNGEVSGPVSNLYTEKLSINSMSDKTELSIKARMTGLPNVNNSLITADIYSLSTETSDIAQIISDFTNTALNKKISKILKDEKIHYSGTAIGLINKFKSEGKLITDKGNVKYNIGYNKNRNKLDISGHIGVTNLELGHIINNSLLGAVSVDSDIKLHIPARDSKNLTLAFSDTKISKLHFKGYDYSNIIALGQYSLNGIDAKIICHDPNLDFLFQGRIDQSENIDSYNFFLDIPYADLHAIKLDNSNKTSIISLKTIGNISSSRDINTNIKDYLGYLKINDLKFTNENGDYELENMSLNSFNHDDYFKMGLKSPFIDMDFTGEISPINFIKYVQNSISNKHLSNLINRNDKLPSLNSTSKLNLYTKNTNKLLKILSPNLHVADSTTISLELLKNGQIRLLANSDRIYFSNNKFNDISLNINNLDSILKADITCKEINIGNIKFSNNIIKSKVKNSKIIFNYSYNNNSILSNQLDFLSEIYFSKDADSLLRTNINILKSNLFINNYEWEIKNSNISFGKKYLGIKDFHVNSKNQSLRINGIISETESDSLKVVLDNLDLSFLNTIIDDKIKLKGNFTGHADVSKMYSKSPSIVMDIEGKDINMYDMKVGDMKIMSKWDKSNERFNLLINNKLENKSRLNMVGFFMPKSQYLDLKLSLSELQTCYVEPFLKNIIKNISGDISGDMYIKGNIKQLILNSENTYFQDFKFTPEYTNVPYTLNGPFIFNQNSIVLNNLSIKDNLGNTATLKGDISHKYFKNIYIDTDLKFKKLLCLNTTENDNTTFYGKAFASGNVKLSGAIDDIIMDVTFKTEDKTNIHVPIGASSKSAKSELLSFINSGDINIDQEYSLGLNKTKKKGKIKIRGKAEITQGANILIEINKQMGDVIKCKGSGIIDINIDPSKDKLDIRGDYTISEGNYTFVLMGITSKDFIINDGASIAFNGDLENTNLNLKATYRTKASVSVLVGDKNAVDTRRIVDCKINMNGPINNPQLSFDINIPDLDPITKGKVESALSTNDKIQKQFMALLVSGSFIPDEQSGIVNNTTLLYANAGEILSNQFNNVFRQLGIPLDLGLNYQPGEEGEKDLFDVALSYQAFNNRVLINGNVGTSQKSTSSWQGNFEAEVKIDKNGKYRIKLFTRSQDEYSNYLDNTQRSGLGFTIQDEFDTFGELFRNIFYSKRKKEKYELKKLKEAEDALIKEAESEKHEVHMGKVNEFNF